MLKFTNYGPSGVRMQLLWLFIKVCKKKWAALVSSSSLWSPIPCWINKLFNLLFTFFSAQWAGSKWAVPVLWILNDENTIYFLRKNDMLSEQYAIFYGIFYPVIQHLLWGLLQVILLKLISITGLKSQGPWTAWLPCPRALIGSEFG